jgi:uridine phosphorylase
MARDPGDRHPATGHLTLGFRFSYGAAFVLSLDVDSSLGPEAILELSQPPFQQLQAATDLTGRLLSTAGELGPRLLATAGKLVACVAAPADDIVDQLAGALARARGGTCGGSHRSLDGGADGVGDPAILRRVASIRIARRCLAHLASQHNPRAMTAYLRPTAPIAADVLVPADPGVAMALAQRLMVKPLMANHHHGLWGYSGCTESGRELTIQATGIGAPSAVAVLGELAEHGARRLIRIGRCAALDRQLTPGDTVLVASALGADGTSAALGAELAHPDRALTDQLKLAAAPGARSLEVVSFDLGGAAGPALRETWAAAGIAAIDLATAAALALGERLGLAVAGALVVTESAAGIELGEAAAEAGMLALGELAERAFERSAEPVAGG